MYIAFKKYEAYREGWTEGFYMYETLDKIYEDIRCDGDDIEDYVVFEVPPLYEVCPQPPKLKLYKPPKKVL